MWHCRFHTTPGFFCNIFDSQCRATIQLIHGPIHCLKPEGFKVLLFWKHRTNHVHHSSFFPFGNSTFVVECMMWSAASWCHSSGKTHWTPVNWIPLLQQCRGCWCACQFLSQQGSYNIWRKIKLLTCLLGSKPIFFYWDQPILAVWCGSYWTTDICMDVQMGSNLFHS